MSTQTEFSTRADDAVPKLVFRSGPCRGKVIAVDKDEVAIGRDAENDIVVEDDIVSSRHVILKRDARGNFWLQDLGSKNGTYLNGKRIHHAPLGEGDVFCLCQRGPEVQLTSGKPSLPSLLATTTRTLVRSKSLETALGELLPLRSSRVLVTASGVREILDRGLEHATRRSRRLALAVVVLCAAALGAGAVKIFIGGSNGTQASAPPAEGAVAAKVGLAVEPIYGSLFLSYRDHPIGTATIRNEGSEVLKQTRLAFTLKGDGEDLLVEECLLEVPDLEPGRTWSAPLQPKLSKHVLSERTREVTAYAALLKNGRELAHATHAVLIHAHHAFNWERPERVTAFIDPEDPLVLALVKAASAQRPESTPYEFPPPNVVGAVSVLATVAALGLSYVPDAETPFSASSRWKAGDRVNYPGETLRDRGGDCDDLAVLASSLLEAARIPTALVVGDAHVLVLFDSGVPPQSVLDSGFPPESVVTWQGRLWLPVEPTELAREGASITAAWAGAWHHRQAIERGRMAVVDVRKAWEDYRPLNPAPRPQDLDAFRAALRGLDGIASAAAASLASVKELCLKHLLPRAAQASKDLEGLERAQATGLFFAQHGLYSEAARVLAEAVFLDRVPESAAEARAWKGALSEDAALLLSDLALALSLSSPSRSERERAAAFYELALGALDDSLPEKANVMLRLALLSRLLGEVVASRAWEERALALQPSLGASVDQLFAAGAGSAAGEDRILEYLRAGLR